MRCGVYVRISDDKEGRALGVKRQEADCRALAKDRKWDVVAVYSDNDTSAVKKRAGWDLMLKDIAAGKIDAVVAYSSSRLYRDVDQEKGRLFKACQGRGDVLIETVASGTIDPYTADGRMLANIIASIDQGERERVAERVRRKRKEKAAHGEFQGGFRPFGFEVVGKRLEVRSAEANLIRRAATDVLNGVSVATVTRRWNERGVRTTGGKAWTKGHVKQVLAADRNVPAILTRTDHDRVTRLMDGRRTGRAADRYLLTGILECGRCGRSMSGRGGKYVCQHGPVHLTGSADAINGAVLEAAAKRPDRKARKAHDPSEKLVQQRERLVREQEALGESPPRGWSEARIAGRDRAITREVAALDKEIEKARPQGFYSEMYQRMQDFDERAWLEGLIERVVLEPAQRGANRFSADRLSITWRR